MTISPGSDDEQAITFGSESLDAVLHGRYRSLEIIEARRGALLYRATQVATTRTVLVKLLIGERAAPGSPPPAEVTALAALTGHTNIVDLLDAGTTSDGVPFIITEWVGAGTLADLSRSPDRQVDRLVTVISDVAAALDAAHRLGIIHCDVKPSNILVGDDGRARLADFGIARVAGEDPPTLDDVHGTVNYLAPEVLDGGHPSSASDIYSLAQTMWEVLESPPQSKDVSEDSSGRNHFLNDVATSMQHPEGRRFDSLRSRGASEASVELLERGLANDPSDRPDAAQMHAALESVSAGINVGELSGPATGAPRAVYSTVTAAPSRSRRRWLVASIAMVVAASIIGYIAGSDTVKTRAKPSDEPISVAKFCSAAKEGLDGQDVVVAKLIDDIDKEPSRFDLVRHLVVDLPKQLAIPAAGIIQAAERLDSTHDSALLLSSPVSLRSLMLADGIYAVTRYEFITDQQSRVDRLSVPLSLRPLVLAWDEITGLARTKCGQGRRANRKATALSLIRSRLGSDGLSEFFKDDRSIALFDENFMLLLISIAPGYVEEQFGLHGDWVYRFLDKQAGLRALVIAQNPELVLVAAKENPDFIPKAQQADGGSWIVALQRAVDSDHLELNRRRNLDTLYRPQLKALGVKIEIGS